MSLAGRAFPSFSRPAFRKGFHYEKRLVLHCLCPDWFSSRGHPSDVSSYRKGGVVLNDATCGKVKSCLDCPYPDVPSQCLEYIALPAKCDVKSGVRVAVGEKAIAPTPRYVLGHDFDWAATYSKNYDRLSIIMYHKRQFIASLDIGDTHTEMSASVSVKIAPALSMERYVRLTGLVLPVNYGLYNQLLRLVKPGHLLKYTKSQTSIQEFHAICDELYEKGALNIA